MQLVKAPKGIKVPNSFDKDYKKSDIEKYYIKVRRWIKANYTFEGINFGRIVKWQVGDGYAKYMILNMNPPILMHMPVDDKWEFRHIHLMTSKDIEKELKWEDVFTK